MSQLARFENYLTQDPDNLHLLADAAEAALRAGHADKALALIARHAALASLPRRLQNLRAVALMTQGDFAEAEAVLSALHSGSPQDGGVAYNLAWCRQLCGHFDTALSALDNLPEPLTAAAATLKIQLLHRLGRLNEALEVGEIYADAIPKDQGLMSALAVVAIDASNLTLARRYALRGGGNSDAIATLGALDLAGNLPEPAEALFDQALSQNPDHARAHMGKGLCRLLRGDAERACLHLDRCAKLFGGHLGSWVAAGWAQLLYGDKAASRARFEYALGLDDTFAETHGALAVLDIMDGQLENGRRRAEIAGRLDQRCFSAALAKSLLAEKGGDAKRADRIRQIAMATPLGDNGRTLASTIAALGLSSRRR